MIMFDRGDQRFNYRIVGVLIDDGRVLLHREARETFWTLPGGRAELLEPASETIRRELREELAVEVTVERLLWVVENFFSFDQRRYHELALYFLVTLPPGAPLYARHEPFWSDEQGVRLLFQWFRLDQLATLPLYPSFLRAGLLALPEHVTHVVHTDVEPLLDTPEA